MLLRQQTPEATRESSALVPTADTHELLNFLTAREIWLSRHGQLRQNSYG